MGDKIKNYKKKSDFVIQPKMVVRKKCKRILNGDFMAKFYEKYPDYKRYKFRSIKNIIGQMNQIITDRVANHRDGVVLPRRLGILLLAAMPYRKHAYSYDQRGVLKRFKNFHTNEKICKIYYTPANEKYTYSDSDLWRLENNSAFRQQCSLAFKQNYNRYVILDRTKRIVHLYDRRKNDDDAPSWEDELDNAYKNLL